MSRIKQIVIEIKMSINGLKSISDKSWRISELKDMGKLPAYSTERENTKERS